MGILLAGFIINREPFEKGSTFHAHVRSPFTYFVREITGAIERLSQASPSHRQPVIPEISPIFSCF